ncbi:MAG: site-specific integrase [Bacteroidales bacterium]|nr:site-specific integrase [Bacteroidales bacterium]
MATTKLYLDLRGKAKDGKGSVLILLYHNFTTTSFSTGIRIAENEWDRKTQRAINVNGADAINASLQQKKCKIDRAIAVLSLNEGFDNYTAAEIKHEISEHRVRRPLYHKLVDLFQDYVNHNDLKEGTKEIYRITLRKIAVFAGDAVRIEDVDYIWVRNFDCFLAQTQSVNGRSIYLRALRSVCNHARKSGILFKYPFDSFKIKAEPTMKRSMGVTVFRSLMSCSVSEKTSKYRDYFLLMFFLIGINIKDLLFARKSQIDKGRLEYIREKTHKKYSIKIEPEAQILLDRYEGKDYLLDAMDSFKHYKSFLKAMNKHLQSIEYEGGNLIPEVTSYFTRHCWATFAFEIGIPVDTISQALGHSFGNRTTLIYIRQDQSKVDEANRRVIDYVLGIKRDG